MGKRSNVPAAQRTEAVLSLLRKEEPASRIARRYGVSEQTLAVHGAVHERTAGEMAEGARRVAGATYGLATSGIAGPDGGSDDKPVGTVCIGLAGPERPVARRLFFPFGKRLMNKKIFAMAALDMLRRELFGLGKLAYPGRQADKRD